MTTKGKASVSAATPTEAMETAAYSRAAISCNHSITAAAGRQQKISPLLLCGQENALPRQALEALTGLDGRTVRLLIEQERRAGSPILSDNATGYYLPATREETAACVRSMRHRAGEILRTARAIERGAGID